MSLDVYLTSKEMKTSQGSGIFIRHNGSLSEVTEEEWRERNPGQTPLRSIHVEETNQIYWANITHNFGKMANHAGIYEILWRPEEVGITKAQQLIEPLKAGLTLLKNDPERFEQYNAENGWGKYEHLVSFVEKYLNACIENPEADVHVNR